jgi:hypothetical protein
VFTEPIPAPTATATTTTKKTPSADKKAEQQREVSRQATLAMIFLRNADPSRYHSLLTELANSYAAGRDQYPKDLLTAYSLLLEYKTPFNHRPRQQDNPRFQDPNRPTLIASPPITLLLPTRRPPLLLHLPRALLPITLPLQIPVLLLPFVLPLHLHRPFNLLHHPPPRQRLHKAPHSPSGPP